MLVAFFFCVLALLCPAYCRDPLEMQVVERQRSRLLRAPRQAGETPEPGDRSPTGQTVRLVGGQFPGDGTVEAYTGGAWRRVSASRWSEHEASVVCRQLGYVSRFAGSPVARRSAPPGGDGTGAALGLDSCSGQESTLLDCARAEAEDSRQVAVTCLSAADRRAVCGGGALPFGASCFRVGSESVSRLKAEILCRQRGERLVTVTSQLMNDFLSDLLVLEKPEGFHTAGISQQLDRNTTVWLWRNSTQQFHFTRWLPGALSGSDVVKGGLLDQRCLVLELSKLADGTQYASWVPSSCNRRLQYVCEAPITFADCAAGRGDDYAGRLSTAESGRPCLPWSAVAGNAGLSGAALTDNHCRNPDGDERPWCFTGAGRFEYCDVPACPARPPLPTTAAPAEPKLQTSCGPLPFACTDEECVGNGAICDGKRDCSNNRDELVCDALKANYQVFANSTLGFVSSAIAESAVVRYTGISSSGCQYLCLTDRTCRAAVWDASGGVCLTSRLGPGRSGRVKPRPGRRLYVALGRRQPCAGHQCADLRCLGKAAARCDGLVDCDDGSDELGCGHEYGLALRLAGGGGGGGRLEARVHGRWGAVCDSLFGPVQATLACRQLGFRRARRFFVNGREFAAGSDPADFSLTRVACSGAESELGQCLLVRRPGQCGPGEHVSLQCTDDDGGDCRLVPLFFQCQDGKGCATPHQMCNGVSQCADGSDESLDVCKQPRVRLLSGTGPQLVQVKPRTTDYLLVTASFFGDSETNYLCRWLGLGDHGVAWQDTAELPFNRLVANVLCRDGGDCAAAPVVPLPSARAVRLRCLSGPAPPPELRLVGGSSGRGLLEVRPPLGRWGRVCTTSFSSAQAEVACRQLGLAGPATFISRPRDPAATVSVGAMDCLGGEATIRDCLREPWLAENGSMACRGGGEVYLTCQTPDRTRPPRQVTELCQMSSDASQTRPAAGQPWYAGVLVPAAQPPFRCGAAIVSPRHVLTAAHCLLDARTTTFIGLPHVVRRPIPPARLAVAVGDRRLRVRRAFSRRDHGALAPHHSDLALLELEAPLAFSAAVQPACLPQVDGLPRPADACVMALPTADAGSLRAIEVRVTPYPRARCERLFGRRNITHGTLCAGGERLRPGTCAATSGEPLVCRTAGPATVVGVGSWGCGGSPDSPIIFTRVAAYFAWIHDIVAASTPEEPGP